MKHQLAVPSDPLSWVTPATQERLRLYADLLMHWNQRVNLVARSSQDRIFNHHIRHSLCLAWRTFPPGSVVLDWGTGGGLPTVPLAMSFPETQFVAVDSIGKKTAALKSMVRELGLSNVRVWQGRAEHYQDQATHCVSRATAPLAKLWKWSRPRLDVASPPVDISAPTEWTGSGQVEGWSSGLLCLKGGDLAKEIRQVRNVRVEQFDLQEIAGPSFAEKHILQVTPASR
ncbi:MAG: 16S rRNA (guanine(527)-N(7))-methyltransferase RsmG [Rhodothermales bacterium]|nr:16S rRNA (guanine(527)-N(7))-methyltransferase RsmG [Rhodothermales bacterium]